MATIPSLGRHLHRDLVRSLKEIEEEETLIKTLAKAIIQEVIVIGQRAKHHSYNTILKEDLENFIEELGALCNAMDNKKLMVHFNIIHAAVYSFIRYLKERKDKPRDKVDLYITSISNVLRETILKDLEEKDQLLERIRVEIMKVEHD